MPARKPLSFKSLLVLVYLLVLLALIVLLVRKESGEAPPSTLSHAEKTEGLKTLSIYGANLNSTLKGVLARNLVNEKAFLGYQLVGVPSRGIDIEDDIALVSCYGRKVVSLDLHDSQRPELLDSVELPSTINQIRIVGDQALVGMHRNAGLIQLDLKDPRALQVVRSYPLSGSVMSMAVARNYVYYADLNQGIGRIDLSAKDPVLETLALLDSPWRIALQGEKLVVGSLKEKVHLFTISRNGQLIEVGILAFPVDVRGVALTDKTLAIALADSTMKIFSLSSWPKLNQPVEFSLPGVPLQLERVPDRERLVVGMLAGGVALVDVAQPEAPALKGHLKLPTTFMNLSLQADRLYATSSSGLELFSLKDIEASGYEGLAPDAMIEGGSYLLQSWQGHVYGYDATRKSLTDFGRGSATASGETGRFVAVADNEGVRLFEKLENGELQRAGSLIKVEGGSDARFRDNYLFITHKGGLRILSGTRPEDLVATGELPLPGEPGPFVFLGDDHLLIATREEGALVVNVSNPHLPVQVAALNSPSHQRVSRLAREILVDGDIAYLALGVTGLYIVDLSVPQRPEILQIIETFGSIKKMVLHDDLLLVAAGAEGLLMFDVKNRKNALAVGRLPTPIRVEQLAVMVDGLLVSDKWGGTMKLPLPQRLQNLQVINAGEMRADVETIEKGQYVYLYDKKNSVSVQVTVP